MDTIYWFFVIALLLSGILSYIETQNSEKKIKALEKEVNYLKRINKELENKMNQNENH